LGHYWVKLFIDECLSPQLAARLNATGRYDAVHPLHVGRRGEPDHRVVERCIAEDRIIVTENARDFRRLIGGSELHPGLIILPALDRDGTWRALQAVLAFLEDRGNSVDMMVNHVLEIDESGRMTLNPLPPHPKHQRDD
jgi:predicted nuclease of predicted toxin-antitoxin system